MSASLLADAVDSLGRTSRGPVQVVSTHTLTRGVSGASVVRVGFTDNSGQESSIIVKASAPGNGGLRLEAAGEVEREARIYGLHFSDEAKRVVYRPEMLTGGSCDGATWIVLEDVAESLKLDWDFRAAVDGVVRIAQLDVIESAEDASEWLVSREHRAFEHYLDQAAENLARLQGSNELACELVEAPELDVIRACLDGSPDIAAELDTAPHAFQHGDFNNSNAGFRPDGALTLIDWAQAGSAPVGADLAVFLSGFSGFGGDRGSLDQAQFDERVTNAFCRVFQGGDRDSEVRRVLDLWWTSWAVQVRLGPGLQAAWGLDIDSRTRKNIIEDVREGLVRAERAANRLRL